jgi:hypothetical protein
VKHKNAQHTHSAIPDADVVAAASQLHATDEQEIRERAYAIHQARGEATGSPEGDWLEAEQQLKKNEAHVARKPRS